jgi:hypothetical protein
VRVLPRNFGQEGDWRHVLDQIIPKDNMWEIDPIDLWTAAVLLVGYSLPFLALELEFKLQELKKRAEDKEIRKALLRRLTGHN